MKDFLFTSESVSEGHPDKLADQLSDSVLDALLEQDPSSRVACEALVSTGLVVLAGEVSSQARINYANIVRDRVRKIGYDHVDKGFDYKSCSVLVSLDTQSPDIAMGVNEAHEKSQGAGDQGLMFGYAVNETPTLMPLSISLAHQLMQNLANLRKNKKVNWLRPDSKSQVTVQYEGGRVKRVDTVVVSTQHDPDVAQKQVHEFVRDELIASTLDPQHIDNKTKFFVNPTGRFVLGGPHGDCGLTGRKIIVDTYGGHGAHGGGAFSGKDPSKVDRSAAYAARHIAKNIVAAGLAEKCLVQLAYAIGVAEPVSIMIEDFGTGAVGGEALVSCVKRLWDLRPAGIIQQFDLLKPRYTPTAAYGHFGRSGDNFSWESTDKVNELKHLAQSDTSPSSTTDVLTRLASSQVAPSPTPMM